MRILPLFLLALGAQPGGLVAAPQPKITHGVASGDLTADSAVIWSRCDLPARMILDVSIADGESVRHIGSATLAHQDFTAKYILRDLPTDAEVGYQVSFQSLAKKVAHPGGCASSVNSNFLFGAIIRQSQRCESNQLAA